MRRATGCPLGAELESLLARTALRGAAHGWRRGVRSCVATLRNEGMGPAAVRIAPLEDVAGNVLEMDG